MTCWEPAAAIQQEMQALVLGESGEGGDKWPALGIIGKVS